ncbi:MAG: hypothetical protein ACE5E9_12720 [Nitrospinaceae bacterium]
MNRIIAVTVLGLLLIGPQAALGNDAPACQPPYQPTNLLKLLLNYKPTLHYIATAPESCEKPFVESLREVVRSTILMSQGCIDVTLEDIDKAEKSRKPTKPSG